MLQETHISKWRPSDTKLSIIRLGNKRQFCAFPSTLALSRSYHMLTIPLPKWDELKIARSQIQSF